MKTQPTAQQFIDIADNCWNDTEIAIWYTKLMRELNPNNIKRRLNEHGKVK